MLAALVAIKIATSMMSPDQVGTVNQLTSVAILLSSAFIAPVTTYFGRGFLLWLDAGELRTRLRQLLVYVLAAGLVLSFAAFAIQAVTNLIPGTTASWVLALAATYLTAYSVHLVVTGGFAVLGERAVYAGLQNIAAWCGLGFALALFWSFAKPEAWLLGIYGGFVVSACALIWLIKRVEAKTPATDGGAKPQMTFTVESAFAFAWPQAIVYALWWIQSQSYRFILDDVAGLASVGLFFAAYALCSMPMQTFETLFNEYYAPTLYGTLKNGSREEAARAWNEYASAYVPAVVLFGAFLVAVGPGLAVLLLGPGFREAGYFVLWPALAETARAISSSLYTMGIVKLDMKINIPPVIAGAIAAPVLVYLLAPHAPLAGTGQALFLASLAVLAIVIPISRRALNVKWPRWRIALAVIAGLPLLIGGELINHFAPSANTMQALMVVALAAFYLVVMQYLLARSWIHRTSSMA